MVQASVKKLTLEAFLATPETKPASEFIDGQIVQKPMPKGKHSLLQLSLSLAINEVLKVRKVALALPEIRCSFGNRSIVPDIGVFTWQHLPLDENGEVANEFNSYPDWAIEILSPKQNATKVTEKMLWSLEQGTETSWIIDPESRLIVVYLNKQQPQAFRETDQTPLPVPEFASEISLTHSDIFGWLKP